MQFSKLFACAAMVVALGAFVEATRQYNGNSYNNNLHQSSALSHYGGSNRAYNRNAGNNGPYHSYAVQPALYGGHRMYNYQGYTRHGRPSRHHDRRPRNQHAASNSYHRQRRPGYGGARAHRAAAPAAQLPAGYTLKPISALALVPISHGSSYYNQLVHGSNGSSGNSASRYNHRSRNQNQQSNHYRESNGAGGY